MNNSTLSRQLTLATIISISSFGNSYATFDVLCGKLSDPPEVPAVTMLNYLVWDTADHLFYNRATTITGYPVAPVTVQNNPGTIHFYVDPIDRDAGHYIDPPATNFPGLWTVTGTSTVHRIFLIPPPATIMHHPDNPFTCFEAEVFP